VNWTTLGELDSSLYWTPLWTGLLCELDSSLYMDSSLDRIPLWTGLLSALDISLYVRGSQYNTSSSLFHLSDIYRNVTSFLFSL
jgi:hypothetical protein